MFFIRLFVFKTIARHVPTKKNRAYNPVSLLNGDKSFVNVIVHFNLFNGQSSGVLTGLISKVLIFHAVSAYVKNHIGSRINLLIEIFLYVFLFFSYSIGRSYSFDEKQYKFDYSDIAFFAVYVGATLVINYLLLPAYFNRKKYWSFLIGVIIILVLTIFIEEFVLEQILFPDTRGKLFLFFRTLGEIMPFVLIPVGFKAILVLGKKQFEIEQLQKLIHKSELQFLKNQINPHFLFNNLNNLYAQAVENSRQVPEIILQLSNVLRYMLYDCKENYVMLNKELKHIEYIVGLYELQIGERGHVQLNIACEENNLRIAPLMLNVFVENAFKHSTSSVASGLHIFIDIKLEGKSLHFTCVNNFTNRSNTQSLGHGIGLENVKNRLDMLYPDAHKLSLEKKENEFIVELTIKLADD